MKHAISGLVVSACCYGILWLLLPLWNRGLLPDWTRFLRGIVAWVGVGGFVLPVKGLTDVVIEMFTAPTMGTGFALGFYAFLFTGVAWVVAHSDIVDAQRVKPLIVSSLLFRREHIVRSNVFAGAEQREINDIYREQTGKELRFGPGHTRGKALTPEQATAELRTDRLRRQEEQGKEEIARLQAGETVDVTDVLRLFTMHGPAHPRLSHTFTLSIDPSVRVCRASTVFPGFRREALRDPDAMFRFRQELIDLLQVLTGEQWMIRFRPFFDSVALECYREVRDSFDLPQRTAFLRLTLALTVLDEYKGRILIATELENLGTVEWLEGDTE